MGHVGLTPQSATKLGGFRAQGRTADAALRLYDDALALEAAGCFAIVLEAVPAPVAARISAALSIPTIGIGAGGDCDGQVLVWHDLLGLYSGRTPRFVKRYAELADEIADALAHYAADVRSGAFPEERHTYSIPDEELDRFEAELEAEADRPDHEQRRQDSAAATAPLARAQVRLSTARTPITSSATVQARQPSSIAAKTAPAAPESEPPLRNTSPPKSAIFTSQTPSEHATGTHANASRWRARR